MKKPFYLLLTLAMTATTFYGFSLTYFGPTISNPFAGTLSPTVHVHGWSFFLWYLLVPLQAGLVAARRIKVHQTLGIASIALASLMMLTGVVVLTVQVAAGSPFWATFGLLILSNLVLFAVFYVLALRNRRRPEIHKRYMVLASSVGVGAAMFRIMLRFPAVPMPVLVGVLLTNLFIIAAMVHDHRTEKRVHPVYIRGLAVAVVTESLMVPLAMSGAGGMINDVLGSVGRVLGVLYF